MGLHYPLCSCLFYPTLKGTFFRIKPPHLIYFSLHPILKRQLRVNAASLIRPSLSPSSHPYRNSLSLHVIYFVFLFLILTGQSPVIDSFCIELNHDRHFAVAFSLYEIEDFCIKVSLELRVYIK